MFEKKQVIFSDSLGVCRVDDITKLSADKSHYYNYYLLRSLADKKRIAYIPVENHTVALRELISAEEAKRLQETSYEDEPELRREEIDYVLKNMT